MPRKSNIEWNHLSRRLTLLIIICVSILALTGCTASLKQVKAFSSATELVAGSAVESYEIIDHAVKKRKIYDIAADTDQYPTGQMFDAVFTGAPDDSQKATRLKIRLSVLNKLGAYATALSKLSSVDFQEGIESASTELNGALLGLKTTYHSSTKADLPLSDDHLSIISTAVRGIGGLIAEKKRAEAIKTIILNTDGAIQAAAGLISDEFREPKPGENREDLVEFVYQSLINVQGSIQIAYNVYRQRPDSQFGVRLAMLQDIWEARDRAIAAKNLLRGVAEAANKMGKAHHQLSVAARGNDLETKEIIKAVGELVDYSKDVQKFYKKLNT